MQPSRPSSERRDAGQLPRLTSVPGCGGQIRRRPEDFVVEELPAYQPCGEGEHLFLWIEKSGTATPELARQLAKQLVLPEREVSYAGMKDKDALTRQFFCVPARAERNLPQLQLPGAQVRASRRHRNKLRTGHLRGNRFQIRIRSVRQTEAARAILEQLRRTGYPNYFGPQRFGRSGDNSPTGKRVLLGERSSLPRFERKLYLSAYQSLLFNRCLAARIEAGTFDRAQVGDVMRKLDSGGIFVCEDPEREQGRLDRFEISATGPLFGPKMVQPTGAVAEAEQKLLEREGLSAADFCRGKGETEGSRRAYRLPLEQVALWPEGPDLWLSFELPKGSYATVVLREVMGD